MWSQNQLLWQQQQWAAAAAASAMQQQAPAQGLPSSAVLAPVPVAATESKQEDTDKAKASGRSSTLLPTAFSSVLLMPICVVL